VIDEIAVAGDEPQPFNAAHGKQQSVERVLSLRPGIDFGGGMGCLNRDDCPTQVDQPIFQLIDPAPASPASPAGP
jgi:hypothetical protein